MALVKELREKLVPVHDTILKLRDKAHTDEGWTPEERASWEQVNKDYDHLSEQISIAERAESVERELSKPVGDRGLGREDRGRPKRDRDESAPSEEDRALAFQAWCRYQMGAPLTDDHREAAERTNIKPHQRHLDVELASTDDIAVMQHRMASVHPSIGRRALSDVVGSAGAFTVPKGFVNNLEIALLMWGGIRQVADVMRTESGIDMPWPSVNDTAHMGRRIAENTQIDTSGTVTPAPSFGQPTILHAYKYTSDAVLVPTELLEDSAFNLSQQLGDLLGTRLGRITNYENTLGNGVSMPNGIVNAATVGVTAASETAIAADEIISLCHSVDPAYRPGAGYMMHDSTVMAIRKLKDAQGQYLWIGGIQQGVPDKLYNYPLQVNQHMPTIAAGATTMVFGALKKIKVREVRDIRLYRLEERYRDSDQDGFVAFMRQDCQLLDAGTHPVKSLKQAA